MFTPLMLALVYTVRVHGATVSDKVECQPKSEGALETVLGACI